MTMLELYENGVMDFLVKNGALNIDRYAYKRYYDVWKAYKKQGLSNNKAYTYASDETGVSEITVRKAVKFVML